MKNWMLIFLSGFFSIQAWALGPDACQAALRKKPVVPVAVRDAFLRFRSLGLNNLLADVYDQKINVSTRRRWLPTQPAVSARVSWAGRKNLIIRKPDLSTPLAKQKFVWQVAMALFELQMQPSLWSRDSVLASNSELTDSSIGADDDALDYFALQMPQEWRDQHLARAKGMLSELYLLFCTLDDLKEEDIMAATDPGRHWILKAVILKDASRHIAPNVEDFKLLRTKGLLEFGQSLDRRHSRSLLFNYYMNHVRRMMVATSVISTLMLTPYLQEIPSYIEAQQSWSQYERELQKAPARADAVEIKTMEHLRAREIERLKAEIEIQMKKTPRDESLLAGLTLELKTLGEKSPGSFYAEGKRD